LGDHIEQDSLNIQSLQNDDVAGIDHLDIRRNVASLSEEILVFVEYCIG